MAKGLYIYLAVDWSVLPSERVEQKLTLLHAYQQQGERATPFITVGYTPPCLISFAQSSNYFPMYLDLNNLSFCLFAR